MVDTNKDGNTQLHFAASSGHILLIDSLLASGAEINVQNRLRQTPLHIAYMNNQVEAALHLIGYGAEKTSRTMRERFRLTKIPKKALSF